VTTDAAPGADGVRSDVGHERWLLDDQRQFLLRSIDDAERELLAGDLSPDDYDVLLQRDQKRLAEVEAELASLGPLPEEESRAVSSGAVSSEAVSSEAGATPRRRLGTGRTIGILAACLLIIIGLVILIDHAMSPGLPGQAVSGSITESKVELIEQELSEAATLNNNGDGVQALQLYDRVLSEDPADPDALAASGWLEWNYGEAGKSKESMLAGRRAEERAITLAPTYYAGHLFLGLILLNQDHNVHGALVQFAEFLADSPPNAELVNVAPLVASGYTEAKETLPPALAKALATETASTTTTTTTTTTTSVP
jgi:tetratricopeptide (TPR) repeat protein